MSGWWVHMIFDRHDGGTAGAVAVASWTVAVIGSIVLHELAHGWAALRQGDGTPRELGRMTLDPMVHMGGFSLLLFAILGIAWGVMPVNPARFRNRRWGSVLVAAAGPAMNLALFLLCSVALGLLMRSGWEGPMASYAVTFLSIGGMINALLCLFNLLPMPPLDGWRILEGLFEPIRRLSSHPNAGIASLMVLMLIFMTGAFSVFWGLAAAATAAVAKLVAGV